MISLIIAIGIGSLNYISHNNDAGSIQKIIDVMMFDLDELCDYNTVSIASSTYAIQTMNYSQKYKKKIIIILTKKI